MRVYIAGDPKIHKNYARAVTLAGGTPCFNGVPESCGALLLPGGGDMEPWRYGQENTASRDLEPERDAQDLALLERFTQQRKPILGICRGMQAINVFFGGDLVQNWPGHSAAAGADRLHRVRTAPSLLQALYGPASTVNSCHHQTVGQLGNGLKAVQWAEDGVIEAFFHKALPIWGIQWHPERLLEPSAPDIVDGLALYRAFLTAEHSGKSGSFQENSLT